MELTLNLQTLRTSGSVVAPLDFEPAGPVEQADIALLEEARDSKPPPLKRISERHHALARTLASGMSQIEAALIVGYDRVRVSILMSDPTFQELVATYRHGFNAQVRGIHDKLVGVAGAALDELEDRLEEDPKQFSTSQLKDLAVMGADRTGNGPSSTSVAVNINVGLADKLRAARERAMAASGPVLDLEATRNE